MKKIKMVTQQEIKSNKIHMMQLDPNGFCNSHCWYCPVKYYGNKKAATMSLALLEKIFFNIVNEREKDNGLVDKNFSGFFTANYNEILLYPYFEEMLGLCKKYKLHTCVLSNGTTLTKKNVHIIEKYIDYISGISLNIPAFDPVLWSRRTGLHIDLFGQLISNVHYAIEVLGSIGKSHLISIVINGVTENSLRYKGGWIDKGINFPNDIDLDPKNGELACQFNIAKNMFKDTGVTTNPSLIDRAGWISHVITNLPCIKERFKPEDFIMCGNGVEVGGRPLGWLHINSVGESFLCCNDFNYDFVFGDFNNQQLSYFWGSEDHMLKINKAYNTICLKCAQAKYKDKV